jgi:AcrR family transcriptional regulator
MKKSSQMSEGTAASEEARSKTPSRERGRRRVEALLSSAATVLGDKGYHHTTMTEIAAAAGSSIGSLYQFFPTKEAVVKEVLRLQIEDLDASLNALQTQAAGMSSQQLGETLCYALIKFRASHPSFEKLIDTPGADLVFAENVRKQIRERLTRILLAHQPQLDKKKAAVMAVLVQQLMKSAVQLNRELGPAARTAALQEIAGLLHMYLDSGTAT